MPAITLSPTAILAGSAAVLQAGYLIRSFLDNKVDVSEVEAFNKAQMSTEALRQDVEDTEGGS